MFDWPFSADLSQSWVKLCGVSLAGSSSTGFCLLPAGTKRLEHFHELVVEGLQSSEQFVMASFQIGKQLPGWITFAYN